MFSNILFPIHQSKKAIKTIKEVIKISKNENSFLTIASITKKYKHSNLFYKGYKDLISECTNLVNNAGINFSLIEYQGEPLNLICNLTIKLNIDVIILGTKGINLTNDTQSTVSRIIKLAPCPVIVVP